MLCTTIAPKSMSSLELTDYKNDCADVAAEKLLRKCSTRWEAYQYLQDSLHDTWLPDSAREQVRMDQSREYGWAFEPCGQS